MAETRTTELRRPRTPRVGDVIRGTQVDGQSFHDRVIGEVLNCSAGLVAWRQPGIQGDLRAVDCDMLTWDDYERCWRFSDDPVPARRQFAGQSATFAVVDDPVQPDTLPSTHVVASSPGTLQGWTQAFFAAASKPPLPSGDQSVAATGGAHPSAAWAASSSTPLEDLQAARDRLIPQGDSRPTAAQFDRLLALHALSDQERAFVRAALEPDAPGDLFAVVADWLEEQGRPVHARFRESEAVRAERERCFAAVEDVYRHSLGADRRAGLQAALCAIWGGEATP